MKFIDKDINNSKIKKEEFHLFVKLADSYFNLGNFQKALQYYHKLSEISPFKKDSEFIGDNYSKIGNTYWQLSDFENSLKFHQKALDIFKKKKIKPKIAQTNINIGNVYQSLSNFENALNYFLKALKIFEEIGNKYGIGIINNNLGSVFLSLNKEEKALHYFQKALKIFEEIDYQKGMANSLNNIGAIYYKRKLLPEALKHFQSALAILKKTGSKSGIATALNNIGDVFADSNKISKALSYFTEALKFEKEIGDKYGISLSLRNIGNLKMRQKNWKEANDFLEKSLEIAREIDAVDLMKDCYLALSELYAERENYYQAFLHYKKFSDLKDKIYDIESEKKLSELQIKYETEKKEKEAEIYRLQNIVLVDANKQLKREIRERKKAQEALQMSEKKFRSLFETASEFIFIMDKNLKILEINPATLRHSGYTESEMLGKKIISFLAGDCKKQFHDFIVKPSAKNPNSEIQFIRKDKSLIIMDCSVSTIFDKKGKLQFYYAFLRDITRKKEIEKMKNEFVSQVSHELRSPLASIKGFTSTIIQDKNMDEETRNYFLSIIDNESDRLSRLIENLLDISKIESGYIKMNFEENPVQEIIELALSHIKPLAEEKHIQLMHSFLPKSPIASFDRDKIFQVLTNLLSNAIKFTPENGTVKVDVQESKNEVELTVEDTGIGIPANDLENIFKKFFRVEGPEIQVRGTGLGLAIVKEIIQSHQGKINVESEPGKGTKFHVFLPKKVKHAKKNSDS